MNLFDELQRLRLNAGQPSYREIAQATGKSISTSGVHNILHYHVVPPKWEPLLLIVQALHGDEQYFFRLWQVALLTGKETLSWLEEELSRALILDQAAGVLREYGIPGDGRDAALRVLAEEAARLRS